MEVNFNNLRKQACIAYDRLCRKINAAIDNSENDDELESISTDYIQKEMDELRMMIGAIAMCYEEGNPDTADVYTELYGDGSMESFNPNAEE